MSLERSSTQPASDADRLARVALSVVCEPGDLVASELLRKVGAPAAVEVLRGDRPLGPTLARLRESVRPRLEGLDPRRVLDLATAHGIRFLVPADPEWPASLDDLETCGPRHDRGGRPAGLWVRGPASLTGLQQSVAVVGSRSATTYGVEAAVGIAGGASRAGLAVVSGLAFGIDKGAHRGAIAAGGLTVAVLARGLDQPYPKEHGDLFEHIAARGAVVSEVAPGCAPTRLRFLARNRLIAALTRGTVVVEAAARSGALNTANWAALLNRVLMGVPGPITVAQSQGVHALIRSGAATLVRGAADVLELLGEAGQHLAEDPRGPVWARDALSSRDQQILDAVPLATCVRAESISRVAGVGLADVVAALERMARAGLVRREPTGWRLAAAANG